MKVIDPFSIYIILSTFSNFEISFVTKILPLSFKKLQNEFLNIILLILLSIEEKGSSNKYISASLYKHLARAILAFWPPLTLVLLLLINVSSFSTKFSKSLSNWQSEIILYYHIYYKKEYYF